VDCAGGCFVSVAFSPWIADARKPSGHRPQLADCLPRVSGAAPGCRAPFVSKLGSEEALLALAVLRKREGDSPLGAQARLASSFYFTEADQDQRA
jgi:hypothetical protein